MNIVPTFVRRKIADRPGLVKIVDNISWLIIDKVIRMGLGLLVGIWVARYLGPEQFGLFNFAAAFVGLFATAIGLGLQSIVVRDIVRNPHCKEETLGTAAVLQLLGGFIAYGATILTIFWLRPDDSLAMLVIAILGSVMLFRFSDIAVYWFESQVMSKYIVWIQNICVITFAPIKIILILNNASLIAFAWISAIEGIVVACITLLIFSMRGIKYHELQFSWIRAKTLLIDSWPLLISVMAIAIYMKIDQIMLGQMVGDDAVGIYSAAVRISEVWYFIPLMIVASVFPSLLETKKRDENQYQQRLQQLYDLMVWLSIAIALPMTFLSTTIITTLFGSTYSEAGSVLVVHIWASIFVFLGVASSQSFIAENRQILSLHRALVGAILNVLLNLVFIPVWGPIGASIATVLSQAVVALFFDALQRETKNMFKMKMKSLNPIGCLRRIRHHQLN